MFFVALAAASAVEVATLDLELSCPGQYQDTETSSATVSSGYVPDYSNAQRATISREVMRPGTTSIKLHGSAGTVVYPDGVERTLTKIVADEKQITAEYVRKLLFVPMTWRMNIDRLTGDVRITNGGQITFAGTCAAAPTKPKF